MNIFFRIGDDTPSCGVWNTRAWPGRVLALSLTLLLVACAGEQTQLPRETAGAMQPGGESGAVADVIFVVPPEGAPLQTGLVLADAIAAEIRDANHPAILAYHSNQAGASIVGKVLSAVPGGNVTWLTIDWSVRAPYGTFVDTYRQRVVIDKVMWDEAAPEAINLVIADAAPKIVKMVNSQIGPPTMAAMTHRNWRDQSNDDQFKDKGFIEKQVASAPRQPISTTMSARMSEAAMDEPMVVAERPVNAAPIPVAQPLGRIADATNGQVVGAPKGPLAPLAMSSGTLPDVTAQSVDGARAPLPSLLTLPPIKEPERATSSETRARQVATLPSLGMVPTPSGPPTALTPGASRTVSPPPGGLGSEPEESLLDKLKPNLGSSERRAGDARPSEQSAAQFAEVRWGQPAFLIRPVVGAPGNGNEALTAALKSALRNRDLTISEDPRQAGFIIDGQVDLGEPVNGRQYVKISWVVNTVTGEEVGKAVQENTIVAGSLDGEWGEVAEVVSQAAVRGIQDLFGDADEQSRARVPLPDFPNVDLPAIPGRAPPPPSSY